MLKIKESEDPQDQQLVQILSINLRHLKRPPTEQKDDKLQIEIDKNLKAQGALTKAEFREKYTLHPH